MGANVVLAEPYLEVDPGEEASCDVLVVNSGEVVDQFTLVVVGPAREWAVIEPSLINLLPGDETTARVLFRPPRSSEVPAGTVSFGVRAQSREDSYASAVEEGEIEVAPFSELVAELVPATRRGWRRATYRLAVDNNGNHEQAVEIVGFDQDDELEIVVASSSLRTQPGTATIVKTKVLPHNRFLRGETKTHPFQLVVQPVADESDVPEPITVDGVMLQEQLLPKWLPRTMVIALLGIVALAALWFTVLMPTVESLAREQAAEAAEAADRALLAAERAAEAADSANDAASATPSSPPPPPPPPSSVSLIPSSLPSPIPLAPVPAVPPSEHAGGEGAGGADPAGGTVVPGPETCWRTPNAAWATAIQSDGKVVVAGSVGTGTDADILVSRYTYFGDLDTTFGVRGQRVINIDGSAPKEDWARGVAIQSDGKIVVAGTTWVAGNPDVVVVRLTSGGTLDTTFDADGKAVALVPGNNYASGMAIQTDGKIVVGGTTGSGSATDMMAVRFTTTGALDTSYGSSGVVVGPIPGADAAYAVRLDSTGKAVLAGESDVLGDADFAAMRLNTDGSLDTTFHFDGVAVFGVGGTAQRAYGLAIDADDRPVLGGETWKVPTFGPANWDFAVLRFNTNGTPDTTFDTDGFVTTPIHDYGNDGIGGLAIGPDGTITVAGNSWGASSVDFAAARYTATGALDTSYGTDGKAVHPIDNSTTEGASAVALDGNGNAVLAGRSTFAGGELAAMRLTTTGALDTSFNGRGIVADRTAGC